VSDEKAWLESERVWLVHRGGFTAGRQVNIMHFINKRNSKVFFKNLNSFIC